MDGVNSLGLTIWTGLVTLVASRGQRLSLRVENRLHDSVDINIAKESHDTDDIEGLNRNAEGRACQDICAVMLVV